MKTEEGTNVKCEETGKVCYTEREAGEAISNFKRHIHAGSHHWIKGDYSNSKNIPRRKYYCQNCGYYHLTHLAYYGSGSVDGHWEDAFYREYDSRKRA